MSALLPPRSGSGVTGVERIGWSALSSSPSLEPEPEFEDAERERLREEPLEERLEREWLLPSDSDPESGVEEAAAL